MSSDQGQRGKAIMTKIVLAAAAAAALLTADHRSNPPLPASPLRSAGLFILSQCAERPERYGESFRFDTIPSSPSWRA
jgi:hypothetical protein